MEIKVILQNDPCAMTNIVDEDVPDDNEILVRLCLTRINVKVGMVFERTDMEASTAHKQIDLSESMSWSEELV